MPPKTCARQWWSAPGLQSSIEPAQSPMMARDGKSLLVFKFAVTIGIAAVGVLAFPNVTRQWVGEIPRLIEPSHDGSKLRPSPYPARLVIENQVGAANEPLPLGTSLTGGSGEETVTLAGLAEGTELSLGTSLGAAGWLVSARDLDKTFVGAPLNFVGAMDATVHLRSASGQLLDHQTIRFEWIEKNKKDDVGSTPAPAPSESAPILPPLSDEQVAALIIRGQELLSLRDVGSARLLLKRAALAGNAHAALAFAKTFDQAFLAEWGVLGLAPDAAQAREWYDRANKLGATEASRHLERLARMPQ